MKPTLFADKTPKEIEKFEKDTGGIILHNEIGENSISFQNSNGSLIFYADKVKEKASGSYPNLFIFSDNQLAKLFNHLSVLIAEQPDKFKFTKP